MIHAQIECDVPRTAEADVFLQALDQLSARDQRILARLARRLATLETAHGEDVALAVAQRMETVVRRTTA